MMSLRFFLLTTFASTIALVALLFVNYYISEQRQSAKLIVQNVRSDLSTLGYNLSKYIKSEDDIQKVRLFLDRKITANNFLKAIFLADDKTILLGTSKNQEYPSVELYTIPNDMDYIEILNQDKIFHQSIYYYDQNIKKKLELFMVLDKEEVHRYVYEDGRELIISLSIVVSLFFIFILYIFSIYLVNPLEKLRQYAYYQSSIPKRFLLRELEYIRSSMIQTFDRLERERRDLYISARTDSLSGLANRESLSEKLGLLLAASKRDNKEFALLFLDLDHFKNVNDFLGHKVGDVVLQEVSRFLKKVVRENDIIARVGGDEFIIVIKDYSSMLELTKIIRRIQDSIKVPFMIEDHNIELTSSVGIAFYPQDGLTETELIKNADIAMFKSKEEGRDNFYFFTQELNNKIQEEIRINIEMRDALRNNEFELYYQPKVDIKSQAIVGCEALIRWNHPTRGMIAPYLFIPLAERDGFIVELGKWILSEAMHQQVSWKVQGICDIPISINLSVKQLVHVGFEEELKEIIKESKIQTDKIDVEIVESLFLHTNHESKTILDIFERMGITVSLDDFGTGYSSLSYLKDFKIDTLKVDKVFIDDFSSKSGSIFLETIIKMGQTLQLKVLCEGVETEEQLEYLKKLDCELYQGYLCSKPLPSEKFEELYLNSTNI